MRPRTRPQCVPKDVPPSYLTQHARAALRWEATVIGYSGKLRSGLATRLLLLITAALGLVADGAAARDSRWGEGYLPNVPVLTQNGQTLRFYEDVLKGRIVVISFIYTSCRDICPIVTARLAQLEEKLGDALGRDIFFVSISVDPVNDTPEKLNEYAKAFHAAPSWLFLTGERRDIDVIRFKLGDRGKKLSEHRNEVLLFNGVTGEWERASIFSDLGTLAMAVRAMDPAWRNTPRTMARQDGRAHETPASRSVGPPGQALFLRVCASCHTIGRGIKVGPDLIDVSARRERAWLLRYISAPEKMHSQGDATARELAEKYKAVRMPNLGLSEDDASDLLSYLDLQTYLIRTGKEARAHRH